MHITYSQVVPTKGLLGLLEGEKYTDVTFLVEEQSFRAHRIIVASQSDYFDRYNNASSLVKVTSLIIRLS